MEDKAPEEMVQVLKVFQALLKVLNIVLNIKQHTSIPGGDMLLDTLPSHLIPFVILDLNIFYLLAC